MDLRIRSPITPPFDFRFIDLLLLVAVALGAIAFLWPHERRDPLVILTEVLPRALSKEPYIDQLVARGGAEPYVWSLAGAPPGLTVTAHGVLRGTLPDSGRFNVAVRVSSYDGQASERSLTLDVIELASAAPPRIATTELMPGRTGTPYAVTLAAEGGALPYTWRVVGLPAGLTLERASIVGTPAEAAVTDLQVEVVDGLDRVARRSYPFRVLALAEAATEHRGQLRITARLPQAVFGNPYAIQLAAAGGRPPYQWKLLSNSWALVVTPDGVLSADRMPDLDRPLVVRVLDEAGAHADSELGLRVIRPGGQLLIVSATAGAAAAWVLLLLLTRAWLARGPRLLRMKLTDAGALVALGYAAAAFAIFHGGPKTTVLFMGFMIVFGGVAYFSHD